MVPPEQFEVIKQQFVEHLQREHLAQLAMQAQVCVLVMTCLAAASQLWACAAFASIMREFAAAWV